MGSFLGPFLVGLVPNEMKVSEAWKGEDKPIWQDFPVVILKKKAWYKVSAQKMVAIIIISKLLLYIRQHALH